jgi:LPS export ABC transporter protein LptC
MCGLLEANTIKLKSQKNRILFLQTIVFFVAIQFGCESNFREVQKIGFSEFTPSGQADTLTVKYTDSGKIKAILVSPKMLDYGSVQYPFTEFPKGIFVTLYDNKAKKTFVKSDYAVKFNGTDIIDLKGNVLISSEDGQFLETQQLYYDQKNEWFYTEQFFKMTDPKNGNTTGQGVDFDKNFRHINYQKVTGILN